MENYSRTTTACWLDDQDDVVRSFPQMHDNLLYSPPRSPSPAVLHHCIASLHRQDGTILSIAAANGLIFTGSSSRRIRSWRQPDCTERGHFKASHGDVREMLAHGTTLFTVHGDRKVRVWDFAAAPEEFRVRRVATLPKNRSVFRLPWKTGPKKHRDRISCMAYDHTEGVLYTGSLDRTVKAWTVADGRCVDSFTAHDDGVNDVAVSSNGDGCLFTCSSDSSVKIWRRVYGQGSHTLTMTLRFQPSPVNTLALSLKSPPGSCFLYSGSSDGFVNFWEKERSSGRFNHGGFLQGHRYAVLCLATAEELVFSGSEDATVRVWRREEGSGFHDCLAVVEAHAGPVNCLVGSPAPEMGGGFLVYSSGLDQTLKVWRIKVVAEEKPAERLNLNPVNRTSGEYEISPVLSPSWVEKKLRSNSFH